MREVKMPNQPAISMGQQIVNAESPVRALLQDATLIGGIYTMGFDECLVLTNDIWKHGAGGVPQHAFLVATAMELGGSAEVEDEEVILLRVVGPARLPAEADLVSLRAEAMREIVTSQGVAAAARPEAIVDVLTRNEMQFSALSATILGTFYEAEVGTQPVIEFGNDIRTYYSASRYRVYKPYGRSLATIASYPAATRAEEVDRPRTGANPARVRLGTVRYTSTRPHPASRTTEVRDASVPVTVNIEDFIAMKTAVFGMTRLGKSNTMKIIACAVFEHAKKTGRRIGQLLFDPAGEYANVNAQDQTALSELGQEHVTVFRFGATPNETGVRSLSINFFDPANIQVTWAIIGALLPARTQAAYVQSFLTADVVGPEDAEEDRSAWERARRRRAALYATLVKAGFRAPGNMRVPLKVKRQVLSLVNERLQAGGLQPVTASATGEIELTPSTIVPWWNALADVRPTLGEDEQCRGWVDAGLESILTVLLGNVGSGWRLLQPLQVHHSPLRSADYAKEVLAELVGGKVVIVDLSRGTESVLKFASERIVNEVIRAAARRFADGELAHSMQIYIEEAHRLFSRDRFEKPDESDPYVRLAKEAAKFKIGLVYATQEVTAVDPAILANTSNWVVTHLNNIKEVEELSKYYDFKAFEGLALKAEDVGFVRVKTRSGRYIIPVQVDLFDAARIASAKQSARDAQVAAEARN